LVTISAIILGILLQLLLDFSITNVALYYFSIILIANLFTSIIDFLIVNFNDVGKFLALIILVLQLAAAGGTFPIETVTKGFRWLNNILPMKYTIDLLKESLVAIETKLLIKNLIIVISIFLVFFIFNIINDKRKEKKLK
jgi:putative membrane protein